MTFHTDMKLLDDMEDLTIKPLYERNVVTC